jgi:hypothetical protein
MLATIECDAKAGKRASSCYGFPVSLFPVQKAI